MTDPSYHSRCPSNPRSSGTLVFCFRPYAPNFGTVGPFFQISSAANSKLIRRQSPPLANFPSSVARKHKMSPCSLSLPARQYLASCIVRSDTRNEMTSDDNIVCEQVLSLLMLQQQKGYHLYSKIFHRMAEHKVSNCQSAPSATLLYNFLVCQANESPCY